MYPRNCFSCDGRRNSGGSNGNTGPTGATGPTGTAGPTGAGFQSTTAFSLVAAPKYKTGQVVTYMSSGYVVKKGCASRISKCISRLYRVSRKWTYW
ncbi:hypothetical protein ACT7CT_09795 [Bacillus sanguinis]